MLCRGVGRYGYGGLLELIRVGVLLLVSIHRDFAVGRMAIARVTSELKMLLAFLTNVPLPTYTALSQKIKNYLYRTNVPSTAFQPVQLCFLKKYTEYPNANTQPLTPLTNTHSPTQTTTNPTPPTTTPTTVTKTITHASPPQPL